MAKEVALDIDKITVDDIKIPGAPEPPKPAEEPKGEQKKDDEPKSGDEKKEEPKAGDEKKGDEPKPGDEKKEEPKAGDEKKSDEPKEDDEEEAEIDFGNLSEITGLEIESTETLVSSLKELKELRSLSPALKKAIEIEKNKGDVAAYFKNVFDDPDKLSEGEALWRMYENANPKLVAGDREFARLDFERTMKKEYSLLVTYNSLPADQKDEFLKEHKDDIEYEKKKYEVSVRNARASLKESQKEATFYEPGTQITEKELEETLKKHEQESSRALSEFDAVSIGIDDESEFKIGISDANKQLVTQWIKKPEVFMNKIGIGNDGIDYNTLLGYMTLIADIEIGSFGKKFKENILSSKDLKTLEEDLNGAKPIKRADEQPPSEDEWDQVGNKMAEKREAKRK